LPYSEVPIKLVFSARKRLTPAELAARSKGARAARESGDEVSDGD
jgi:hypothetical protein